MTANAAAEIAHTPAASPSIPSEKFTTFMSPTSPISVSASPSSSKSTRPMNGTVTSSMLTPESTSIERRADLAGELERRRRARASRRAPRRR